MRAPSPFEATRRRPLINLPDPEAGVDVHAISSYPTGKGSSGTDIGSPFPYACPECGGPLVQVRRRVADRLLSLLIPVRRFRCSILSCGYEGNLRV
jgi:hypothetical protein